jgi:dTDP-glucose 4,6-dehydratase
MRYFITGGAGFIGSHFVRMLLAENSDRVQSVTVLDKFTYSGNEANLSDVKDDPRFTLVRGDICDVDLVRSTLPGHDVVVHFAAESHVDRSIQSASPFILTNVLGTQNLLECARNAEIPTFVHVSTDEVYGSISEGSWTEEEPLLPNSPYAASKASSDLVARSFHQTYGMDIRITRCSNNFGSHQYPEKMIPLFITNLMDGLKVPLYGDGQNIRDWLHVSDHCRGVDLVAQRGKSGEIYNIGGGRELTNNQITNLIVEAMGADESSIEYVEDRKGHDLRYSVDWTKINRELGYKPQVKFEDGLRETIQWYRDNEPWWKPLKNRYFVYVLVDYGRCRAIRDCSFSRTG